MSTENGPELSAEIKSLLESGKKIAAVKLYRERTTCSLTDAVHAVEAIDRGGSPPDPNEAPDATDEETMDQILLAIEQGKKLKAIKIYKTASGNSLKVSKQFAESLVDQLDAKELVEVRSGCASLFLLGVALAGLATETTRWILG